MRLIISILLLLLSLLGYSKGFDYDEDDIRTLVKRQANYYNNYDYNAETTTIATTKKKLIKKCPTNAAGKRIKCKKKRKKTTTTTTSTTEQPSGIPQSYWRGPSGINPISFFLGPGTLYSNTSPSNGTTIMSTKSTSTSSPIKSTIPVSSFGGNFVGLPMMLGGLLPTGSPINSSIPHMPAALVSGPSLNLSAPGEFTRLSPAGAMQIGFLPKIMKSLNASTSINDDPIVSGSTTTPLSLTTTGLISKLGNLTATTASSGSATSLKPAGLSNVTNSISTTSIASSSTTKIVPSYQTTTILPNLTTVPSNMGSLLGRVGMPFGMGSLPENAKVVSTTVLPSTTVAFTQSTSALPIQTTASTSSTMGSLFGRAGLPFGLGSSSTITTAVPTSVLPILGISPTQSTVPVPTSSSLTTKSSSLQLDGSIVASSTSFPSSTFANTATTLNNSVTTIGSAVNGTLTTKSNALTSKKSKKTTKKKRRKKTKKSTKKNQSKKTTKKAKNQQVNKENANGTKKQN